MRELFLPLRFFWALGTLALLFAVAFWVPKLFRPVQGLFALFLVLLLWEAVRLWKVNRPLKVQRRLPTLLSLGDDNRIQLDLKNRLPRAVRVRLIEELPFQLQRRDFEALLHLPPESERRWDYFIRPVERGEYHFGRTLVFLRSPYGLLERRLSFPNEENARVYPSVLQMKRYELALFSSLARTSGIKRLRRVGHSYEFDQIKPYNPGDDYRSINWKATSRRHELMVNQYEEERAQQVYCVLDKSRTMHAPFEGMTTLDWAVNASLVIANIILKKQDKAGLLTFSRRVDTLLKADRKPRQLTHMLHHLYREQPGSGEANYEALYRVCTRRLRGRSLLLLFTNFESPAAFERILPYLQRINHRHLLVVIFFKNREVEEQLAPYPRTFEDLCLQTAARQWLAAKELMLQKLRTYGIHAILTHPVELNVDVINKYLELKALGRI